MENTATSHDNRLRMIANRMLRALEALPAPETYADVQRAARALISVKKALDMLRSETDADWPEAETEAEVSEPAVDEAEPPMNRQMRRMADALARKQSKAGTYRRFASG